MHAFEPAMLTLSPPNTPRSGLSSNLLPKMNTPERQSVLHFVQAGPKNSKYSLDGQRGSGTAKLCRAAPDLPPGMAAPGQGRLECVDIAMEGA